MNGDAYITLGAICLVGGSVLLVTTQLLLRRWLKRFHEE